MEIIQSTHNEKIAVEGAMGQSPNQMKTVGWIRTQDGGVPSEDVQLCCAIMPVSHLVYN